MPHAHNLVIGAGLAGLASAYHLSHGETVILEASSHPFGIADSRSENGFTWDKGPHASFTEHQYVRDLFAKSAEERFAEVPVRIGNRYYGGWIDHPAQTNLYQAPEALREACVADFLKNAATQTQGVPADYREWLESAFGRVFTDAFPAKYTRKYWAVEPEAMATEWVGRRVFRPQPEDVTEGAKGPLPKSCHYVKTIRYPLFGGYRTFAELLARGADIRLDTRVVSVDIERKSLKTADGIEWTYDRLVSSMPLNRFVDICVQSTPEVREAAAELACSEALVVDVEAPHPCRRPESWLYVYDEDMLSTRINFIERLSPNNAPEGCCGIQTEVYAGPGKPFPANHEEVGCKVSRELQSMGLLDDAADPRVRVHVTHLPFANVMFLKDTRARLETIWAHLSAYGLQREPDDVHPMTDWKNKSGSTGTLVMAGRYGQWKYFWSDDCVMRGRFIGGEIAS